MPIEGPLCDWARFPEFSEARQARIIARIQGVSDEFREIIAARARAGQPITNKLLFTNQVIREYWDQFKEMDPEAVDISSDGYEEDSPDEEEDSILSILRTSDREHHTGARTRSAAAAAAEIADDDAARALLEVDPTNALIAKLESLTKAADEHARKLHRDVDDKMDSLMTRVNATLSTFRHTLQVELGRLIKSSVDDSIRQLKTQLVDAQKGNEQRFEEGFGNVQAILKDINTRAESQTRTLGALQLDSNLLAAQVAQQKEQIKKLSEIVPVVTATQAKVERLEAEIRPNGNDLGTNPRAPLFGSIGSMDQAPASPEPMQMVTPETSPIAAPGATAIPHGPLLPPAQQGLRPVGRVVSEEDGQLVLYQAPRNPEYGSRYKPSDLSIPDYDCKQNFEFYLSEFQDYVMDTFVPKHFWKQCLLQALKKGAKKAKGSYKMRNILRNLVTKDLSYEQLVEVIKGKFSEDENDTLAKLQAAEQKSTESLTEWHERIFELYDLALESSAKRGDEAAERLLYKTARRQFLTKLQDEDLKILCRTQCNPPDEFDKLLEWTQDLLDGISTRRNSSRHRPALFAAVRPAEDAAVYAAKPATEKTVKEDETVTSSGLAQAINGLVDFLKQSQQQEQRTESSNAPYRGNRGGRGGGRGRGNSYRGRGRGRRNSTASVDSDSNRDGVDSQNRTDQSAATTQSAENE